MIIEGKQIILGISGGIAAYKAASLLRELQKRGAAVTVVMTQHAQQFVTPLTFETLSKNPVYTELFTSSAEKNMSHISLAKKGDLLIVAPATANCIGKFAHGIADDLLSTLFLSFPSPVMLAPAMNTNMYENTAVQNNMDLLKKRNVIMVEPEEGELACGDKGTGRMADVDQIVKRTEWVFSIEKNKVNDCKGQKILITAGPTKEPLDPVRFISNTSSGKMGYALADALGERGGDVLLISGPTHQPVPKDVSLFRVTTCREMRDAVMENLESHDIVIMCAAVCDFSPETISPQKIKKSKDEEITLTLKKNPDILLEVCARKKDQMVIGFAAETENILANAKKKLMEKGLDIIVANAVGNISTGFESDTNKVTIIDKNLDIDDIPELPKRKVADRIVDKIIRYRTSLPEVSLSCIEE